MKHLQFGLLLFLLFSYPGLKAQQNHFIYIQTENKQAFYLKLDKKIYSSSESGYLLVPKLKDGTYNLAIGFPKSEWAEQNLLCTIDNNDIGYLLKNFENKGWGLFNLQTMAVVMATDSVKVNHIEVVKKTDAFSNMLSTVVNDSTIRESEIVKEVKKAPVKEEENTVAVSTKEKDTVQSQFAESSKSEPEKPETVKEPVTVLNEARPAITRILFNKNVDGTEMVFIDEAKGKKDTVRVFIPAEKEPVPFVEEKPKEIGKTDEAKSEPVKPKEEPKSEAVKPQEEPKTDPVKPEEKAKDTRFLEIDVPNSNQKTEEKKPVENLVNENKDTINVEKRGKPVEPVAQNSPMINSDCKSLASPEDFLKLRKKMAAEDNDDDMITLAKKVFKAKCFTVEQVKNLSVLFLKDSGRYAFFDMAYPFVSDSHNFATLQTQLSETYYINRFQSMIRH